MTALHAAAVDGPRSNCLCLRRCVEQPFCCEEQETDSGVQLGAAQKRSRICPRTMTPPRRATRTRNGAEVAAIGAGLLDERLHAPLGSPEPTERRNPLQKAFRILAWAADREEAAWGVREVARELGMAPSTAYRALSALEAAEIVYVDPASGQYRLSLEFFRLASRVAADVPIRRAAIPRLAEVVELTGETAYLGVYDQTRMKLMYVDLVESPHPVQYTMARYEWLDLYAGAGGLGVLSFLPEAEIEQALSSTELKPLTPGTITEPDRLRHELEKNRRNGYVVSVGQRIIGAVGIAAPIFGPGGRVIGDIVLALPASRFSRRKAETLGRQVARAAAAVSSDLGGGAS
jgi:IclR family transcriptional regulator, acetate operon repressor